MKLLLISLFVGLSSGSVAGVSVVPLANGTLNVAGVSVLQNAAGSSLIQPASGTDLLGNQAVQNATSVSEPVVDCTTATPLPTICRDIIAN